jgi:uncharacterized protein (TIGR03067 family)
MVVTVAFLTGTDDVGKSDIAKFQGNWQLVSLERDGKKSPADEVNKIKLTIQGNRFVLKKDSVVVSEGTFKLDAAKKPKEIEETLTAGPNKGKVFLAIYEVDDREQRICFAAPGKDRPKEFSSSPGSGQVFQVWRKETKAAEK